MSADKPTHSAAVHALIAEARDHLGTKSSGANVDWEKVDAGVARAQAIPRVQGRVYALPMQASTKIATVCGALAFAAAIPFLLLNAYSETKPFEASIQHAQGPVLSHVARTLGTPTFTHEGASIRSGESLEVRGSGRVVFERTKTEERKGIQWSLAASSADTAGRVRVQKEGDAIVLALESGALEADVEPGSSVPILYVETGKTRVVVRGTHFRVERQGDDVTVDLMRGKVSVETERSAPHMLLAPTHASFQAIRSELSFTENAALVRSESSFLTLEDATAHAANTKPSAMLVPPNGQQATATLPLLSRDQVSASAQSCIEKYGTLAKGEAREVIFESVLALDTNADGNVSHLSFDPPVHPDAESCLKAAMAKGKLIEKSTTVRLPLSVRL
jgi:FecR protein